ncbi:MAG: TadE/TadG family type IV pilus assembly protein [Hyalangium sp.]|uniref:TadE/TadG family type IV pilus assembly protein n=1 Tax=Hyalangium sp. TaxID=2028555 RepID=UPI00389AA321
MTRARNSARLRQERGASTVEVALSMILLIPTALYSIYVGEAFILGARAQEAEIAASWDITAYRLHDFINGFDFEADPEGGPSLYRDISSRAANRVRRQMAGLNSFYGTGNGQHLVVSQQSLERVECAPRDARGLLGDSLLTFQATPVGTREYLHRGGYINCQAEVRFTPLYMPRDLRQGLHSKEDLLSNGLAAGFTLCGSGDTLRGCSGKYSGVMVLTNDWGLEDGTRSRVGQNDNQKYFNVGEKVYEAKYWADSSDIAGGIGTQQIKESLQFLLDEDNKDYGDTSKFKFGFYNPMSTVHQYPANDHSNPKDSAHLSGWNDREGPFDGTQNVHSGSRSNHNYLGHTNPRFLDQWP